MRFAEFWTEISEEFDYRIGIRTFARERSGRGGIDGGIFYYKQLNICKFNTYRIPISPPPDLFKAFPSLSFGLNSDPRSLKIQYFQSRR